MNAAANDSGAVLVEVHAAVVVVVDHREHADPAAEAPQRLDQRRRPRAGRSRPRRVVAKPIGSIDRRRLDHEPAVLVVLVRHRVRGDRVDHVRVLRLVEEPEDEAHRMEAEVAADEPAARAVGQPRAQQELRRVQRSRSDDDRTRVDTRRSTPSLSTYSTPFASPSSITTRSTRALGTQLELPGGPGVVDVGVQRRLAARSSGSPAGTSRSSCSSRPCRTCTGSSGAPSARNAGSTVRTLLRQSVRSRTPSRCSTRS